MNEHPQYTMKETLQERPEAAVFTKIITPKEKAALQKLPKHINLVEVIEFGRLNKPKFKLHGQSLFDCMLNRQ